MRQGATPDFYAVLSYSHGLSAANQTLQRTPGSLAVLAGADGGAAELVVEDILSNYCRRTVK